MFGQSTDAALKEVEAVPEGWFIAQTNEGDYSFLSREAHCRGGINGDNGLYGYGSSIADCIAQINVIIDEGVN